MRQGLIKVREPWTLQDSDLSARRPFEGDCQSSISRTTSAARGFSLELKDAAKEPWSDYASQHGG